MFGAGKVREEIAVAESGVGPRTGVGSRSVAGSGAGSVAGTGELVIA